MSLVTHPGDKRRFFLLRIQGSDAGRPRAEEGADERRLAADAGLVEHPLELRARGVDADIEPPRRFDEIAPADDQRGDAFLRRRDAVDDRRGVEALFGGPGVVERPLLSTARTIRRPDAEICRGCA